MGPFPCRQQHGGGVALDPLGQVDQGRAGDAFDAQAAPLDSASDADPDGPNARPSMPISWPN